ERAVDVPDLVGRGVVVDAEAAADDRAPRALGIEREAQARAERLLVVLARPALEERRLPLERVVEPRVHEAALVLVAQSEVQREAAAELPVVLHVGGQVPRGGAVFTGGSHALEREGGRDAGVAGRRGGAAEGGVVLVVDEGGALEQV